MKQEAYYQHVKYKINQNQNNPEPTPLSTYVSFAERKLLLSSLGTLTNYGYNLRYEVLTLVTMKIFWNMTPRSTVYGYQCF
jgi:hypothetical protein